MTAHVLFVCLGNICRSPSAQGIFESLVKEAGLEDKISVDSCGTAAFNVGKNPDKRAISACERKGYDISRQIARQISDEDYDRCNYIIAMDNINLTNIKAWAPADYEGEIELFMKYYTRSGNTQIPDPYYSDPNAFDGVIETLEKAARSLLQYIRDKHQI